MINLHQASRFIKHFLVARRKGHGIHSPFVYELCEEVFYNHHAFYDFEILKKARLNLLKNEREIEVGRFGAGSKAFSSHKRKVKDLAKLGISSVKQCELFYKLINYLKCESGLELGTSLGLTTLYLAWANKKGNITTVEGSSSLSAFARELAHQNSTTNIHFVTASFDAALPQILVGLKRIDLVYIDGNHTYDATLSYFHQLRPYLHSDSVLIFDDIYWSKGMTAAWKEIKTHPSVTLSINTFYFGLVFFRGNILEKVHYNLML